MSSAVVDSITPPASSAAWPVALIGWKPEQWNALLEARQPPPLGVFQAWCTGYASETMRCLLATWGRPAFETPPPIDEAATQRAQEKVGDITATAAHVLRRLLAQTASWAKPQDVANQLQGVWTHTRNLAQATLEAPSLFGAERVPGPSVSQALDAVWPVTPPPAVTEVIDHAIALDAQLSRFSDGDISGVIIGRLREARAATEAAAEATPSRSSPKR